MATTTTFDLSDLLIRVGTDIANLQKRMIVKATISMLVSRTTTTIDDNVYAAILTVSKWLADHPDDIEQFALRVETLVNQVIAPFGTEPGATLSALPIALTGSLPVEIGLIETAIENSRSS